MSKNWITRLTRIVSERFGSENEDGFSLESGLNNFERFVHFWVLVWRSFVRNRCPVRASALSYTTLLALIPMLALAMGVASYVLKSEGEERIRSFVETFVDKIIQTPNSIPKSDPETGANATNSAVTLNVSGFNETNFLFAYHGSNVLGSTETTNLISNPVTSTNSNVASKEEKSASKRAAEVIYGFAYESHSKTLGITGVMFLFLTAILTLTRVEETFNDIWGVTRGREWWSRITNYFFTIIVGPVLLIGAVGMANGPKFAKARDVLGAVPFVETLFSTYLPVMIICFTIAMLYKLLPNTKVDFSAALVGGTLAGLAWHGYNHLGFLLISSVASNNPLYASLAAIPLLMGGLYIVWLTVLFGAQVAYAFQNRASYLQDKLAENVNQRGREFVALRLMTCIGQRFNRGQKPVTIREISTELGIPSKLVQQVLQTLLAAHLVVEIAGTEAGYSPARPLDTINCHHVLLAMRATHGQEPATRDEPVRVEVLGEFARIQAAEREVATSVTMLALVNRAQTRIELAAATGPRLVGAKAASLSREEKADEPGAQSGIVPSVEPAPFDTSAESTPEVVFVETSTSVQTAEARKKSGPQNISANTPVGTGINDNESFPL
jgi:membrane protein